ncbi:BAG family molecular chaperone regulator 4 [Nymphon striatum]|nr:BAG family molecular chaperone regulator 4 [Nymphon striatum]
MDDWPSKRFPTRNSSFAGHHAPTANYSTMRSNFDDGVPVRVVRESPEKAFHKQKERHNSTGSSAATSSSAGSNDSTGQSTHKPRVFHIPIQVEPRDEEENSKPPKRASPPRASPEKMRDSVDKEPSLQNLSRSASYASEPPKYSPKFEMPQGIRAQSVPTETLQRRISPERKRLSPERSRGISRTQSMSYRPPDHPKVFHHPIKVENVNMAPRRTSSDPIVEEFTYKIPRPVPYPPGMEGFNTIPRKSPPETVAEEMPLPSSAPSKPPRSVPYSPGMDGYNTIPRKSPPETVAEEMPIPSSVPSKPQRFTTAAQVNIKSPQAPKTENLNHVTRIPINFESPNKNDYHTNVTIEPSEKPIRVSPERIYHTNHFESPVYDLKPPAPQTPSSSANHPQPVPSNREHVENLRNKYDECDNIEDTPKPPAPFPPAPKTALDKIAEIHEDVSKLNEVAKKFEGKIFDKPYLLLEEQLTQNLLKLDVIKTDGKDEVRKARKAAVVDIQASLSNLETRAKRNDSKPNENSNEQEEGYCSMETDHAATPVGDTSMDKSEPMDTKDAGKCQVPTDSETEQTKL